MTGMDYAIEPVPGIDEGGLLHVKGPNVMLGYWRDSNPGVLEPPSSEFGPGWYATGDIAWFDDDGYCHLRGRMKRFAKVAGEMVSLEVSEAIARAASAEALHAATCVADAHRGESIVLFTTDSDLTREQLVAAAHGLGYPEIAVPRKLHWLDDLPVLGTGKIDYVALQKRLETAS
jgi:acyl-[acyl-carrier-protein]-phospholipid O-acyltransferase/long-chain-fatty-acid--[acyl-carrier-protein] ligase